MSRAQDSTARYVNDDEVAVYDPVYDNAYTRFLGNVESYIPDVLQPLSFEQGPTGGGGAGGHYTFARARDRVKFSSQTVCTSYSLRPCQCWEELSDVAAAARRVVDVYQATYRSLLPSQRPRVYSVMVSVSTKVETQSIDPLCILIGYKRRQRVSKTSWPRQSPSTRSSNVSSRPKRVRLRTCWILSSKYAVFRHR